MRSILGGGMIATVLIICLFAIFLSIAVSIATYVFESLGLYRIAERRVGNGILAWVPFARKWLLGKVADQYEEASHNKKTKYKTVLLWLSIAPAAIYAVMMVVYLIAMVSVGIESGYIDDEASLAIMIPILILLLLYFISYVAYGVFYFLALYRLYKSCDEKNTVVYLVLSILVGITRPIFIFVCGKKDSPLMQDYLNRTRKVNPVLPQAEMQ